jgi:hypothetical protein
MIVSRVSSGRLGLSTGVSYIGFLGCERLVDEPRLTGTSQLRPGGHATVSSGVEGRDAACVWFVTGAPVIGRRRRPIGIFVNPGCHA